MEGNVSEDSVVIIDYGLGNLFSVERALTKAGASNVSISHEKQVIAKADRLVLPGVGAFGDGMQSLDERQLIPIINEYASSGRPILGVCLGMQLIMSQSEEFGIHNGLDLVSGRARRLEPGADAHFKVPHIGWNSLQSNGETPSNGGVWNNTILQAVEEGSHMYFVHSYVVVPSDSEVQIATTRYGEDSYCSVLRKDNISGVQFHPELSGEDGLSVYQSFLNNN
jgi:glutamine amidotransferase